MLTKLSDFLSRTPLLVIALILTQQAKLRATCWAMRWLAKNATHEPIRLQYESELGSLSLDVSPTSAHLSWQLPARDGSVDVCTPECTEATSKAESPGAGGTGKSQT